MAAMTAVPANADPLPWLPIGHTLADLVDNSHNFVAWHARIGDARECPHFGERVAMTYPARLDLDQHLARGWGRDFAFDQLEWPVGVFHLNSTHAWH